MDEIPLAQRIDRLEASEAIRQLVYAYALAVDARDLDALVNLYVEDIRTLEGQGRSALRRIFDASLRQFTTSIHHVTNHLIQFLGPDDAIGLANCRIEHEVGDQWVTASLLYHDRYMRRDGHWLFRGRVQRRLYATGQDDPPVGPLKMRWPGGESAESPYYDALPSWTRFWTGDEAVEAVGVGADKMVSRLRGTVRLPAPPHYILTTN